jgi:hypothetical protein
VNEKKYLDYIKSIYRSGKILIIIWGAIGWDYKSPLVFLKREKEAKGVNSRAYRDQVLEPITFPLFDQFGINYIFIKNRNKIHKKHAKLAKLQHQIRSFDWPLSSPDLNIIEKVWRWIKKELKKLPFISISKKTLYKKI